MAGALIVVAVSAFLFVSSGRRGEPSAVEPAVPEPVAVSEPEVLAAAVDVEEVGVVPEPVAPLVEPKPTPAPRMPRPEPPPDAVEISPLPPNWAPAKREYGSVLVRVLESQSDAPVSSLTVWLRRDSEQSHVDTERTPTALTDERGECRFEHVATGPVEVLGFPPLSAGRIRVDAEQENVVVVAVAVPRTVLLSGRVVDPSGNRVAGAGVFQLWGGGGDWAPIGPIARTDDEGNYVVRVLSFSKKQQFRAVGGGFLPSAVQSLELGPTDTEPRLDFTLGAEGSSISVLVVDGEGGPIREASVYLRFVLGMDGEQNPAEEEESWDRQFDVLWSAVTDDRGRAELRGLPRREFRIGAHAVGFAPDIEHFCLAGGGVTPPTQLEPSEQRLFDFKVVENGDTVTLLLDHGLTVEGRVCSPEGAPAAFAVVHAWMDDPPISHWVRADEDGLFRIFNVSRDFSSLSANINGRNAKIEARLLRPPRLKSTAIWNPVLE